LVVVDTITVNFVVIISQVVANSVEVEDIAGKKA
jgi:hypothetical protein